MDENSAEAAHNEAQSMAVGPAFLAYVHRCPHILASVRDFVTEHAAAFAELGDSDEHKLEYTDIHRRFLELLDGHVQAFLELQGASEEDLLAALASVQEAGGDEWKPFKVLLDKTDYYTFAKMMQVRANGVGPRGGPPA
eukprot:CAMPEP_0171100804 /NCGR_PEP_ID=MMETSP0766_2-20121228/53176_1 /TAXON_ID=439317 /ORGANISM="Gambierdiscus australes, Strain CAWD 149" /LENGTH=138 /DNA_ID=CAMNT_0011560693 /DNA_START=32 /DNA_END=448 /DNA_ORIENTATION=+